MIFPIEIDIGASLIYAGFISGNVTTAGASALVSFSGEKASAALSNAQGDRLLATTLLFVGVALLATSIGFG